MSTTNDEQAKYRKELEDPDITEQDVVRKMDTLLDKMIKPLQDVAMKRAKEWGFLRQWSNGLHGVFTVEELYRAVSPDRSKLTVEQQEAVVAVMEVVKSKVDKGVLAVVKTAGVRWDHYPYCMLCNEQLRRVKDSWCPGCGAKIVEP